MPLKTLKRDTADELTLEWVLHVKNYKLALDKKHCVGCQICSLACPKEAIKLEKQPRIAGEKSRKAKVDVDLVKCNFCGICDILCPYGAIRVALDGKHVLSVVEKESFPQLIRDIQVDPSKCPPDCMKCEETCPLDLIKVTWFGSDGKAIESISSLTEQEKAGLKVKVDVQKEYCPCCRVCEVKCPEGVMHVRKFLYGKIVIHPEKCPEGCTDCLDVCPITGALYSSDEDGKIHVNETFCVYCGACKLVCPVEEALELKRTKVNHTAVRSGAWNKALERLTSPVEMTKELKTKGSLRARESVSKRVGLKEERYA
jgi:4Fe-4S ferredoxin